MLTVPQEEHILRDIFFLYKRSIHFYYYTNNIHRNTKIEYVFPHHVKLQFMLIWCNKRKICLKIYFPCTKMGTKCLIKKKKHPYC